ncbi:MAG: hypothetical protein HY049_06615 [Acidobacteria bacterium]|nr:hypothetical protein [Acidobacteriota bacterium]
MEDPRPAEARSRSDRDALVAEIAAGLREGSSRAVVITGPRGTGKRAIVGAAAASLASGGMIVATLDLAASATNPDELATSIAAALVEAACGESSLSALPGAAGRPSPATRFRAAAAAARLPEMRRGSSVAAALAAELAKRRGDGPRTVGLALELAPALSADLGRPILLATTGLDEIGRLVHFPGLEEAAELIPRLLAAEPSVRLLAEVSPSGRPRPILEALERMLGSELRLIAAPSVSAAEIESAASCTTAVAAEIRKLTDGRLRAVEILIDRLRTGLSVEESLHAELGPDRGRLFQELRFDYHLLLERTRGYAASRAILNLVAREEGLDLTGIAARLRRSVGSTLDCLRWLVEIDLVRRDGRRYVFADPLMRLHVLMHEAPERPDDAAGRRALIHRFLSTLGEPPAPLRPRGRPPGKGGARTRRGRLEERMAPRRHDPLIEID